MVAIKICGLKREEDIKYVNECEPDYIGFVFSKSKRRISPKQAQFLAGKLNSSIKRVGVFVNETSEYVKNTAELLSLDVLQFHGSEDNDYMRNFCRYTCWKAIGIDGKEDILKIGTYMSDGIILDNKVAGSGRKFNWNIIKNLKSNSDLILAGGLNEDNVQNAISIVHPDIVDVSSGVEIDGFKDFHKIKNFILKVRNMK